MKDLSYKPSKHNDGYEMNDVEIIATIITIAVWVALIIGVMA